MKSYVIMGIIALVMLVSVVPAMADTTATPLVATGSLTQTLSIVNDRSTLDFGEFKVGDNQRNTDGTLAVTASWCTWAVATSTLGNTWGTSVNDGWMYNNNGGGPLYLTNPLEQYNYNTGTWSNIKDFTLGGTATDSVTTSMQESFRQKVVAGDKPGNYGTTVTYTVAAV